MLIAGSTPAPCTNNIIIWHGYIEIKMETNYQNYYAFSMKQIKTYCPNCGRETIHVIYTEPCYASSERYDNYRECLGAAIVKAMNLAD